MTQYKLLNIHYYYFFPLPFPTRRFIQGAGSAAWRMNGVKTTHFSLRAQGGQAGREKTQLLPRPGRGRGRGKGRGSPGGSMAGQSGGGSAAGTRSRERAPRQARRCRQCPFKGRRPAPSTAYGGSQQRASLLCIQTTHQTPQAPPRLPRALRPRLPPLPARHRGAGEGRGRRG